MADQRLSSIDPQTLAFYEREAEAYAVRARKAPGERLASFLDQLRPGARVLELGCGGGQDAEAMLARGFDVVPTDGSPALARMAEQRLGHPVAVLRFDELDAQDAYDGVWASACLLHAPMDVLPAIFARIHAALRSGGRFYASFKSGTGGGRDTFDRYYNFPPRSELEAAYAEAAPWASVTIEENEGGGYDAVARLWLHVIARKAG